MSFLSPMPDDDKPLARRLHLTGRVQGVGFRPFVYRLAKALGVRGWVQNRLGEVVIQAQGPAAVLETFQRDLLAKAPPLARPELAQVEAVAAEGASGFTIRDSEAREAARVHVPPDLDVCPDCLRELHDPRNRRHRYPFINCTQCGPRYTLVEHLPWDRPNTAMAGFALCPACRAEYTDPANRRFHAEPVACPDCGPRLTFTDGNTRASGEAALQAAAERIAAGRIVAVKGIGGYHLICDATSEAAVRRLRARKARPHKPLAVMFPPRGADGLAAVRACARLSPAEAEALRSPARPIVLLARRAGTPLAAAVAPGMDRLGVFLPCSPLHHLLLAALDRPLVATSGNVSGEPVITDPEEAEIRLGTVADAFLHHDRPILRPVDDSVLQAVAGRLRPLRIGRGLAPLELSLPVSLARPTLAVGGHMKNTVALAWDDRLVISPHIGDLDSPRAQSVFARTLADLQALYRVRAEQVVADAHPGYASTRWAKDCGLPLRTVFHHHAHAALPALERPEVARWLVFTWDGVGLGEDGRLWGGEALLGRPGAWQRVASFRPFHPPGGDRAGREPWRAAAALCWAAGRDFTPPVDPQLARAAWARRRNAPATSAAGRLFDAAAALLGLTEKASFEGQGPMWLEAACGEAPLPEAPPLPLREHDDRLEADWEPLLPLLGAPARSLAERAALFHATLAATLLAQASTLRQRHGEFTVGLAGGVFQNRRLAEAVLAQLAAAGFDAHLPATLPVNDGGLSAGQIREAADL